MYVTENNYQKMALTVWTVQDHSYQIGQFARHCDRNASPIQPKNSIHCIKSIIDMHAIFRILHMYVSYVCCCFIT